jgi:hypothetical protein
MNIERNEKIKKGRKNIGASLLAPKFYGERLKEKLSIVFK